MTQNPHSAAVVSFLKSHQTFIFTFLFLQEEFQVVLDHNGPHGADAVVAFQDWERDSTTRNTVPV